MSPHAFGPVDDVVLTVLLIAAFCAGWIGSTVVHRKVP